MSSLFENEDEHRDVAVAVWLPAPCLAWPRSLSALLVAEAIHPRLADGGDVHFLLQHHLPHPNPSSSSSPAAASASSQSVTSLEALAHHVRRIAPAAAATGLHWANAISIVVVVDVEWRWSFSSTHTRTDRGKGKEMAADAESSLWRPQREEWIRRYGKAGDAA